ncbi:hypothetical protein C8R47DRAFT_1078969 [Mycena vitilis]|nr:hypothetical protein C8R47DRAFT_1078969 [Mycena vitilis]
MALSSPAAAQGLGRKARKTCNSLLSAETPLHRYPSKVMSNVNDGGTGRLSVCVVIFSGVAAIRRRGRMGGLESPNWLTRPEWQLRTAVPRLPSASVTERALGFPEPAYAPFGSCLCDVGQPAPELPGRRVGLTPEDRQWRPKTVILGVVSILLLPCIEKKNVLRAAKIDLGQPCSRNDLSNPCSIWILVRSESRRAHLRATRSMMGVARRHISLMRARLSRGNQERMYRDESC